MQSKKSIFRFWALCIVGGILTAICLWLRISSIFILRGIFEPGISRGLRYGIYLDTAIASGFLLILLALADRFLKGAWSRFLPRNSIRVAVVLFLLITTRAWMLYQSYHLAGTLGFPIDDAWIHFTFANNIAHGYDFSYNPGELGTGSSSPLWTYMLAGGLFWGLAPALISFSLAFVFTLFILLFSYKLALRFWQDKNVATVVVILLALEHYLAWDSLSGMEISLYTALILAVLWFSYYKDWRWWIGMVLLGVALMTRVETIFLAGAVLIWKLWTSRGKSWLWVILGIIIMFVVASPLIFKYYSISGQILPQTYSAKVAPFSFHILFVAFVCTIGFLSFPTILPLALGLPAAIWGWIRIKPAHKGFLPLILFIILSYGAYVVRMGFLGSYYRYLHPYIPLLIISVVGGLGGLSCNWRRISLGLVTANMVCATFFSAPLYGWSVENIEHQQVAMAKWAVTNIPSAEKIAVNDVGAMGYFSRHYIVDLLGLVGDIGKRPKQYGITVDDLLSENIHYLIIYPQWVPQIENDTRLYELARFSVELPTTAGFKTAIAFKIKQ